MSESDTPICDLLEKLLSPDCPPGTLAAAFATVRPVEAAMMAMATIGSTSVEARRERERLKKERQRARRRAEAGDSPPGTGACPIISKTQGIYQKVKKKNPGVPASPGTDVPSDDWPDDHVEQFWQAFPPYRRQAKAKVAAKLARIRAQTGKEKVMWATLFGGVLKFAQTQPGEFAPAPMVWLNDGRWDRTYGGGMNGKAQGTGAAGKTGFSGIAARIRNAAAGDGDPGWQPPDGVEPLHRR